MFWKIYAEIKTTFHIRTNRDQVSIDFPTDTCHLQYIGSYVKSSLNLCIRGGLRREATGTGY